MQTFYGEKIAISVAYDLLPSTNACLLFSSFYGYDEQAKVQRQVTLMRFVVGESGEHQAHVRVQGKSNN